VKTLETKLKESNKTTIILENMKEDDSTVNEDLRKAQKQLFNELNEIQ